MKVSDRSRWRPPSGRRPCRNRSRASRPALSTHDAWTVRASRNSRETGGGSDGRASTASGCPSTASRRASSATAPSCCGTASTSGSSGRCRESVGPCCATTRDGSATSTRRDTPAEAKETGRRRPRGPRRFRGCATTLGACSRSPAAATAPHRPARRDRRKTRPGERTRDRSRTVVRASWQQPAGVGKARAVTHRARTIRSETSLDASNVSRLRRSDS